MTAGRPTLKDVAERAGVSFKTVSRVVNDEDGVSAALTARVQQAVDELGYRRNHSARALRRADQRIGMIGVIHSDIANPFGQVMEKAGAVRDGGSFYDRMGAVACWNAVMDENRYMVRKWNEFIAA